MYGLQAKSVNHVLLLLLLLLLLFGYFGKYIRIANQAIVSRNPKKTNKD